jgi:hypothetical protein
MLSFAFEMVYYVKTIEVRYGDSTGAIDGRDVNAGMGGGYRTQCYLE